MTALDDDGDVLEVWGSGSKPYILKNTGGVLSCSCPAWRNQSKPIDVRSCKHIIKVRGAASEVQRTKQTLVVGRSGSPVTLSEATPPVGTPQPTAAKPEPNIGVMLAEKWEGEDVTGWWMSEKLDGVRAVWDPARKKFFSRQGNEFFAPEWFTEDFPTMPLDGELWMGRGKFQQAVSVARQQNGGDQWMNMFFMVFDVATPKLQWEARIGQLQKAVVNAKLTPHGNVERLAKKGFVLPQKQVVDMHALAEEMDAVLLKGGEGLMVKKPGSLYVPRRSPALLKVKKFDSSEAVVIGIEEGKGRHVGVMGALVVMNAAGVTFKVGGGFSDEQRRDAWTKWHGKEKIQRANGDSIVIELKHQGLTDGGTPRFPIYLRERPDVNPWAISTDKEEDWGPPPF